MITKQATEQEFEQAFYFIERLWDYNVYDKKAVRNVYKEILADEKYRGKGIWQVAEI